MHPYFLPQVTRLYKGAGYNHSQSEAAQLYAEKMAEIVSVIARSLCIVARG